MFILETLHHVQTQIHLKISTFMSDIVQLSLWTLHHVWADHSSFYSPTTVVFRLLWWPNGSHVQNNENSSLNLSIGCSLTLLCSQVRPAQRFHQLSNLTKVQETTGRLCCGRVTCRGNTDVSKAAETRWLHQVQQSVKLAPYRAPF